MALTLERINNLINRSDRTKDFRTANIINSLTDPDTNIFQHSSIKAAKTIHFPHQSKADFPHNMWKDLSFSLYMHSRSFSRSDCLKCGRQPPYPVQTTVDPPSPSSPSIPTHSGWLCKHRPRWWSKLGPLDFFFKTDRHLTAYATMAPCFWSSSSHLQREFSWLCLILGIFEVLASAEMSPLQ